MDLTREELEAELAEKSADLKAFESARDIVRRRVMEVKDSHSRLTPLPYWSGTDAVLGSLDLSIHAIERTIDELRTLLGRLPPKPVLQLVRSLDGDKVRVGATRDPTDVRDGPAHQDE